MSKDQKSIKAGSSLLTVFSVLLGLAAVASTAAFILIRLALIKAYHKKWSDYDDCGVT